MRKSLIGLTIFALSVSGVGQAFAFSDTATTPYKKAIEWMAQNEVIGGYPDGTFMPHKCANRVEFLKMLFLVTKTPLSTTSKAIPFSDVDPSAWYAPYLRTALEMSVVGGYPDGTFKSGQCVNRVEAIKMATLFLNAGKVPGTRAYYGDLRDANESAWYYNSLDYALSVDAVGRLHTKQVDSSGFNFYPDGAMSRKEVAEMLYRMKALKDNAAEFFIEDLEPAAL